MGRDNLPTVFSALIIDADQDASKNIEGALASFGFEFTATQDAPEAMNLARSATPDIIFLRVELPNVSGFSVCNKLRRNDETKYIPLVMYASGVSDDVFNQHRNLKTHADEYLKLPFGNGTLIDAVKGLIELGDEALGDGVPVAASEPEGSLDVDIDDVEEIGDNAVLEASVGDGEAPPAALKMEEFDQDFAEMDSGGSGQAEDLGAETEAAFDALVDEPEPEPEPEPAPQVAADGARDGPTEFRAQREAIQLKSQLNAKNREILGLKDELEGYQRSVLDAKHKNRELLAQIGDLEEKLVAAEELVITAREQSEASARDKGTILKREEGLKTRLDHAQKKIKDLEDEAVTAAEREQTALAAGEASETKFEVIQAELSGALAENERSTSDLAQARTAIDSAEAELGTTRARAGELSETITTLEGDLSAARTAAEDAKAAAAAQLDSLLAEASQAAAEDKAAALAAQGREQAEELEFNETQQRAAIDKVKVAAAETEATARAEVEKLRAQIMEAEEAAQSERERLGALLEEEKNRAAGEAVQLREREQAVRAELSGVAAALVETKSALQGTQSALAAREDAERRAQQAMAVAFKCLDGQPTR